MLAEEILSALEGLADEKKVREYGGYYAGSAFFRSERYEEAEKVVLSLLEARGECEVISCRVSSGKILDSGALQFRILKGRLIEFYDYAEMSACFIRLYVLKDVRSGREWAALYIDENRATPWWAEERV